MSGATVSTESTTSFLAGELDGVPIEEAVTELGYAATVVDGTVIEVDVSGSGIAADAEGMGSAAVSVFELLLLNPA